MSPREALTAGIWLASVVQVAGFTWEAFTQTYQQFGTGSAGFIGQTGPGQANDPAKIPATPPSGKAASPLQRRVGKFTGPTGKPLPFPPNALLDQPSEQALINWLTQHGWTNAQIVAYLKSIYLIVPKSLQSHH